MSGCGGGGDSDADPQAVLDAALGGAEGVDSGVLDVNLDVESSGGQEGSLDASLQGPFQSNGGGALPAVDFDFDMALDSGDGSFEFGGGLTITGDGAYIGLEGTEYQLDEGSFDQVKATYEQSAQQQGAEEGQGSLEQFGIDPQSWVTDLTNEGTEDLDGTEVVHISGAADVPKMIADLNDVAQQTGQAEQLDAIELGGVEDTVTEATIDVYAATADDTFRKLDVGLALADPRGGPGQVDVKLSVGLSDPGAEQEITAPADALPISELLSQIPGGAEALGLSGGIPGVADAPTGSATPSAEAYYDCVAKAKRAADLEACAAQISE